MTIDYEELLQRLAAANCPYKLYPARLRALEQATGERHLAEIQKVITMRIAVAGGDPRLKYQFQSDLETFGLFEAILYFHDYESLPAEFVEEACRLYDRLAAAYLEHHEDLETSDDPRIQTQLAYLRRLGDSREHVLPRGRRAPRSAPNGVADPERPEPVPGYERRLPPHPDLLFLGYAGSASNLAEELIEALQASFMFEGFPGLQAAFFEVADVLEEQGVDVFGSEGQYVLERMTASVNEEMFGDFERYIYCVGCAEEFKPEVSLAGVNEALLRGGWECDRCRGASSSP